ncbi:MAG: aldo/keto reductase [Planctomycetes bacterium]|nr:aldo/keto reductase [Planctomycetota bacterium]
MTTCLTRPFGRSGLKMPVLSCGGMRFQQTWDRIGADQIEGDSQKNVEACIRRALELGIRHIETARGYGSSEVQLGKVLQNFKREDYILQTKVAPTADPDKFTADTEESFARLGVERVDLFALHGLNTPELIEMALRPGGCLDRALKLKKEGRVRFVGFSTHARKSLVLRAIGEGDFDYVNLHWNYIMQDNTPCLKAARAKDMGVFIISPSDKGGMLQKPPEKFSALTQPFHPMVFNDAFILMNPDVHTISVGAARPGEFDEHMKVMELLSSTDGETRIRAIAERLDAEAVRVLGSDFRGDFLLSLPRWNEVPGQVNLRMTLRLWGLAKAFDMVEFGKFRFNLLGNGGDWFLGKKPDADNLSAALGAVADHPQRKEIETMLKEAMALFAGEDTKRLVKEE